MRTVLLVAGAALGIGVVASVQPALPQDIGTWAPFALPGDVVLALSGDRDGVLVGTARGLHHLSPDGARRDLPVPGPVLALATHPGGTYVGTAGGLFDVPPGAGRGEVTVLDRLLTGVEVSAVDSTDDAVVVGASTGLLRQEHDGGWDRLWPPAQEPAQAVDAVLAVRAGILFAHPDGLALLDGGGDVRVVRPDVVVVSLQDDPTAGLVWAGLRGEPLLLVSADGGRSWRARADGLGLRAVETLVRVPPTTQGEGDLVVGGSGLADGTGNAGTQRSTDGGRSWQARQDRLSNTHVYALLARPEPWRVEVSLLGTGASASVPLPGEQPRLYAGTNGSGVSSHRPAAPLLTTVASATPVLRLLEPLLLGVLLLVCLLPAYRHLWRDATASPRPPPTGPTVPRTRAEPSTDHPSHPKERP